MAKKKAESAAPKVTNLPLPISDTPLVIDLPDGQKIVIGKMQTGSVIEVATWRGTGRPDSRTNRLMMGMNSGAPAPAVTDSPQESASAQASATPTDWKSKIVAVAKNSLKKTLDLINKLIVQFKNRKPVATKIQSADKENAASLVAASEVDEWLQKVLERSEKKAAKATQSGSNQGKKPVAPKKKSVAKKTKK